MDGLGDDASDDSLAFAPLAELGWTVDEVPWRQKEVLWEDYAAVIIRSSWDYQKDLDEFLEVLTEISKRTKLLNPLPIVRWNAEKTYLRQLEGLGVRIVPTLWAPEWDADWFASLGCEEVVIKPTVSASAENTYRLRSESPSVRAEFVGRSYMVQPFMSSILAEGEVSLFYFGGALSHAIRKTPKPDDFRVQEEHGGTIIGIDPEPDLVVAGGEVMRMLGNECLYARVDFVIDDRGDYALMELELIEPSLYLRTDADAAFRFAAAIHNLLGR